MCIDRKLVIRTVFFLLCFIGLFRSKVKLACKTWYYKNGHFLNYLVEDMIIRIQTIFVAD